MRKKPIYLVKLGANIRGLRERKNLTQEGLSDLCCLHRTYIGGIERGERNVSIENLLRIASALEVDCCQLVEGLHITPEEAHAKQRP